MKAARIVKLNEPLQVQELQTPTPKGTQILVKVPSVGVCHSDVQHNQRRYNIESICISNIDFCLL